MKYSKITKGFYPSDEELLKAYKNLPDDLVEISDEDYSHIINNQTGNTTINFDSGIPEIVQVEVSEDFYKQQARKIRDFIRSQIDIFVLPTSTINDELVTEEQKALLIQDSLLLARWPSVSNWPFVGLPELSDLTKSIIQVPIWNYPIVEEVTVEV